MRTQEILRRLVRRFGLLVLLTVLGGAAGGAYAAVKTPTYQARAYVVVTAEAGEGPAAVSFAQAYGRVATKGGAAERAAAKLGGTRELNQVTASTSPDAPVIEIVATHTNAARSAVVANAVAQGLVDFAATRKAETRVTVSMLATAAAPGSPSSPKPPLELAVGAAAGLLLAGLAALAGVGRSAVARRRDPDGPDVALGAGTPARPGGADRPGLLDRGLRFTTPAGSPGGAEVQWLGAGPVRPAPAAHPPALANPSPTLQVFAGAVLDGPTAVPAGTPADSQQAPAPVQAVAWYDQAFEPDEMAAVFEGQIEEPQAASEATAGVPRIVGRAVVIYREER
jgi:capsular polysaccharide biosynthesis protein